MPSNPEKEPQLVLNQRTNRFTNIQPYFNYLHERCHNNPAQLNERLEKLIRFVSLYFDGEETDSFELKNNMGFLFDLKDMFENMKEFKSS